MSAALLLTFWMIVASIPAPTNVTSARSSNLKKSLPRSKVAAVNCTVPPPEATRSATALSTTNLAVPVNVVPVVCDTAW